MNAVFCNQARTFIGGQSNQELIKSNQTDKLYAIRQVIKDGCWKED